MTGAEATYAYLASKGFSKETIKRIEAGEVASQRERIRGIFEVAGGPDKYREAQAWAKENYSPEQRARYNRDINSADPSAQKDAVDLMMTRYAKAHPQGRKVAPGRSVGDNGGGAAGGSGAKPYENHAEYQKDLRKARSEGNQALLNECRARLRASSWYTG